MGGPSSSSTHHAAAATKIPTASCRTLLGRVDSTHPNGISPDTGITPNSLMEKLTLLLLFTGKHRAPPPSRLHPATPAEQIRDRAGRGAFSLTTLNRGSENGRTCSIVHPT